MNNGGYMNKQAIIDAITTNYNLFVNDVNTLTPEEFTFSYQQKWTAGQQIQHLILSVKPLVKIFGMNKSDITQMFGIASQTSVNYTILVQNLRDKLQQGGKAPDKFLPETILPEQQGYVCETLTKLIHELNSLIQNFTEQELDTLSLPHPLLGKITMREMLYITLNHAEHHHLSTKHNLTYIPRH